ncbi:hypothetical protein BGZ65_010891, partial [Modicella reniformis]
LHLAAGLYEGHFKIVGAVGDPLTALLNVTLFRANIRAVFKAFFDMDKVENICKSPSCFWS